MKTDYRHSAALLRSLADYVERTGYNGEVSVSFAAGKARARPPHDAANPLPSPVGGGDFRAPSWIDRLEGVIREKILPKGFEGTAEELRGRLARAGWHNPPPANWLGRALALLRTRGDFLIVRSRTPLRRAWRIYPSNGDAMTGGQFR